jgi:[acyl-carrier-protein] S-malonyltransferase
MAPAADAMAQALGAIKFHAPLAPVVANVTAAPESNPDRLRQLLVEQVTGQVRWRESVAQMAARGVTRLIEVGAGKVLTGLGKRIAPDISHEAIHTPEELEIFINSL